MRASTIFAMGLALILPVPALAQKAATPKPAGPVTRYLPLDGVTYGDAPLSVFEGQAVLSVQGGKSTGGSLDACLAPDPLSNRVDRLTGTLEAKGASLVGSGQGQVTGRPWSVEIKQSKSAEGIKVEGRIVYDGRAYPFSNDGVVLSETSTLYDGDTGDEAEGDEATPVSDPRSLNHVQVDVPQKGLADLLGVVSETGASLVTGTVTPTCAALRTGKRTVEVIVAPDRAASLLTKLNATKGLSARMADEVLPNRRVRVPAGESPSAYGEQGERPLANRVSAAASAAVPGLSAQAAPSRDPVTGRWRVVLGRPVDLGDGAVLQERDVLTFTIGRSDETKDRAIVVIEELTSRYVGVPGKGGAMSFDNPEVPSDGAASTELVVEAATDGMRDAVARELGGDVTETETGKWVPVAKGR